MKRQRKYEAALGAVALAAVIAACGGAEEADPSAPTDSSLRVEQITVDDRRVDCVVFKSGYGGGLSCDWTGAR